MVKSGTRKKTSDRLSGCLMAFTGSLVRAAKSRRKCRDQQSVIRKIVGCQWAARSAGKNRRGPRLFALRHRRPVEAAPDEQSPRRPSGRARRLYVPGSRREPGPEFPGDALDEDAEARAVEGGSLAGHRAAKALPLKGGRQVAVTAREQAGKH